MYTWMLLSHVLRAAVTADDAGLVMDSVGDSGVIVSIEYNAPCTCKWYIVLSLYIHNVYIYIYSCLALWCHSPHDSLICIFVCPPRFSGQVLLWEAERRGDRERQLWSRSWRPGLAAVQQAVSHTIPIPLADIFIVCVHSILLFVCAKSEDIALIGAACLCKQSVALWALQIYFTFFPV